MVRTLHQLMFREMVVASRLGFRRWENGQLHHDPKRLFEQSIPILRGVARGLETLTAQEQHNRIGKSHREALLGYGLKDAEIQRILDAGILLTREGQLRGDWAVLRRLAQVEGISFGEVLGYGLYHEAIHRLFGLLPELDGRRITARLREALAGTAASPALGASHCISFQAALEPTPSRFMAL